jgi:hypothetical protein
MEALTRVPRGTGLREVLGTDTLIYLTGIIIDLKSESKIFT